MLTSVLNFAQCVAEISLLGGIEIASVALIVYYVFAKTRAPAIIASLFPNLNLSYRSSLGKFNSIGSDILITLRASNEPKPQNAVEHGIGTQNMLQLTPNAGIKPFSRIFNWGNIFPYVAQVVRSEKFDYRQVTEIVHNDVVFKHAIKQAAEQTLREQRYAKNGHRLLGRSISGDKDEEEDAKEGISYQQILRKQEQRAITILQEMGSTLNNYLLAFTSWLLYKLLPCFLSGVVTNTKQIEMLKNASNRAPDTPLIFVPLHRSHLDYIMVTFILTNNDIRSPLVAAGNNLQIPVFGSLLRGLGAFFIKRKIDPVEGKKDVLYRAALHLYLTHALKQGHNVEFFIEGGRTRTGKPCMPKGGILSVIVSAFMDGSIPDALLVPVSVNYERLVDGNFVREQKGEKKVPETFKKAISGIWKTLNSSYGLMRIDFNEPYSIRELVNSYNKIALEDGSAKLYKPAAKTLQHSQSTSSLYGTDVVCEEHRNLIESISRQVVFDCAAATSVMSTNALAFLLLTRYRNGAEEQLIAAALDDLRNSLSGCKDLGFSGESSHIVAYACDLLGKGLVTRTRDENGRVFIRPVSTVESYIELGYYSNMLTPHFALSSILMTTFHALLPSTNLPDNVADHATATGVTRKKLIDTALENCLVYRYEFILNKPTQVLEQMLQHQLDDLLISGFLRRPEVDESENQASTRRFAHNLGLELDEDEIEANEYKLEAADMLFLSKETLEQQRFMCEVLAPFASTYLAVAQALQILHRSSMLESEFINFVINDLSNKVKNGSCAYAESISTDSVRNCLKLLEKWSVIEVCNQRGMRLISLNTLYEMSRDSLNTIVKKIEAVMPRFNKGHFSQETNAQ
ncbi:LOW QUALITY PROTEIN: glycerol-3-phosphate acyltransferase 1, mitochondrial [Drosophila sulfurigaster albostrigata]|uniref:LOW QUALITY PROTEIN: glycerol-3-phosphate acyltransferase 1, mitochondrial n=1 Tax=Drosophila sulfurigaster albostrigata TaxID=89887 RepID=UPI002D21BCC9|nr:LOW QUALITY PROTEIN: glycerol-3-phosphate acyltransferase 1, mitochondrial [Drosophila sulfurigaster albostrigata]